MEQDSKGTRHSNPRSQGERDHRHYRKTTDHLDLSSEAGELKRCHDLSFYIDHVQPVDFVEFNPDTNTLTTVLIQGRQLFHTLWTPTCWLGCLRRHRMPEWILSSSRFEEIGRWLRLYHESSTVVSKDASQPLGWLEHAFLEKLQGIRYEKLLSESLVDDLEARYIKPLPELNERLFLESKSTLSCQVHGDLIIYNMMLDSKNNLRVLDFGDTRQSANLEDVARFYNGIWARRAQTNKIRNTRLMPLLERFPSGYGIETNDVDSLYFRINLAYNFATHLYAQQSMRSLISMNSCREIGQISRAGIDWIRQDLKQGGRIL